MDCTVHQHTFSFTWQHCCGSRTDSFDTFICYKYNNCRKRLKYVQNIADRLPVQAAFYNLWYMRLKLEVAPNLMASCLVSNQPRYMTIYIYRYNVQYFPTTTNSNMCSRWEKVPADDHPENMPWWKERLVEPTEGRGGKMDEKRKGVNIVFWPCELVILCFSK